jgi:hypothetical protein
MHSLNKTPKHSVALMSALLLFLVATGCKPDLIPDTNVEDTSDNREVVNLVRTYKAALETGNVDQVMALVSRDYFEDNGTPTQEDDYGFEQLADRMNRTFSKVRAIRLKIHVQHIAYQDNLITVDYRYQQRALVALPTGEEWVTHTDVNRLVLRQKGDEPAEGMEIVSGL